MAGKTKTTLTRAEREDKKGKCQEGKGGEREGERREGRQRERSRYERAEGRRGSEKDEEGDESPQRNK